MEKFKNAFLQLPEYYFLTLAILAAYTPPFHFNIVFVFCAIVFLAQIIFKNKITGLLLIVMIALMSILFLGALASEFREFAEFNITAKKLLFVGLAIFFCNTLAAAAMFYKYAKMTSITRIHPQINEV